VVKGSSANKVALSADNFMGTIQSHVMLAYIGQAQFPIEWVREDLKTVAANKGMPTPPGVYLLEVLAAPTVPGEAGYYALDPLYTVLEEVLPVFQSGIEQEAQLQNLPLRNTLRLWVGNNFLLKEGLDYAVNYETGSIQMLTPFPSGATLSADYRWAGASLGPWRSIGIPQTSRPCLALCWLSASERKRDRRWRSWSMKTASTAAQAFGGKFEVSFDFDVIARTLCRWRRSQTSSSCTCGRRRRRSWN
jgi:hypothetical protein